jgi:hypothetical protein
MRKSKYRKPNPARSRPGRHSSFRASLSPQPARQLNWGVRLEVRMGEGNRIWRVLLLVALVVDGFAVLSVVFALLGWWQLIFR